MSVLYQVVGRHGDATGALAIVQKSVTPVSVALNAAAAQNLTFDTGDFRVGDWVALLSTPAAQAGLIPLALTQIATADVVSQTFTNTTAAAIVPTSGNYTYLRIRF